MAGKSLGQAGVKTLSCPSAQPDMEDAQILGVMEQTADGAQLAYAAGAVSVTPAALAVTGDVPPTLVYRFSAPCATGACTHFEGGKCKLASRIVEGFDAVVAHLPPCSIRKTCRWYAQEGGPACQRCPQVTTQIVAPDEKVMAVATGE